MKKEKYCKSCDILLNQKNDSFSKSVVYKWGTICKHCVWERVMKEKMRLLK